MTPSAAIDPLELLDQIRPHLQAGQQVYLVGGAVRDLLRQKKVHDLDFAVSGDVRRLARRVANALGGAFYVMDAAHESMRVILTTQSSERIFLDFTALRGQDLQADLRLRDFTINAIAIDLSAGNQIVDPLGGAVDLRERKLRVCALDSFQSDPVRVLRAVRLSLEMDLHMLPETLQLARNAAVELDRVSVERQRDELFRMLEGTRPESALRLMQVLGVLDYLLPDLKEMQGVTQSAPHTLDVWEHTLKVLDWLGRLMGVLIGDYIEDSASDLALGMAVLRLGRYRQQFVEHFKERLVPDRSLRGSVMLAALYHDAGKPAARSVEPDGRIRFLRHEKISARLAQACGERMALSSAEIDRLSKIILGHMRIHLLSKGQQEISRRATYRFFRDTGPAGVDICLLSMADTLATYGVTLDADVWKRELDTCRTLLEAWWERPQEIVRPPRLVNGNEIMVHFHVTAGPQVGQLLEAIREAQAEGKITDREAAFAFAEQWLKASPEQEGDR
ncbi:tRNA nucleotidyltransferase/poly(A) polymerase [Longilinea arvoryzae]|uniref:tRNA nucleotidyltransferase/poly(A) polymerase n=1 Tax=Longilinea arvoryzae TaxID=360412 RepID=A0A0S7B9M1_9CHLR|nr:HD domain-containing protein [Longilinea arvoryzae]GAP14204.1 tRNA nucleotidyltransferase/poly(A) polymerase [Longilinea arvoryzae]